MKATVFIVCNQSSATRMLKERPMLGVGEQCVEVRLEIPDSLFFPPPIPRVDITLNEDAIPHVHVVQQVMEMLQEVGVKVNLVSPKGKGLE